MKFTIQGQPASKANSRRIVVNAGRPRVIKSKAALGYVDAFALQCPTANPLMTGDVVVTMTIFYASRRPDLDESVILDCMQGKIYLNDRQVKHKHIHWGLDKENPRAEIEVLEL